MAMTATSAIASPTSIVNFFMPVPFDAVRASRTFRHPRLCANLRPFDEPVAAGGAPAAAVASGRRWGGRTPLQMRYYRHLCRIVCLRQAGQHKTGRQSG